MNASIRELRSSTKSILSAVGRGDSVTITYRGKPYARLTPIDSKPGTSEDPIFGMWNDNEAVADVDAYVRKLRKGRFS